MNSTFEGSFCPKLKSGPYYVAKSGQFGTWGTYKLRMTEYQLWYNLKI